MGGGSPLTPLTIPGGTKGPPMGFGLALSERARAGTEGEINPPPHFGIRRDPWDPELGPRKPRYCWLRQARFAAHHLITEVATITKACLQLLKGKCNYKLDTLNI